MWRGKGRCGEGDGTGCLEKSNLLLPGLCRGTAKRGGNSGPWKMPEEGRSLLPGMAQISANARKGVRERRRALTGLGEISLY